MVIKTISKIKKCKKAKWLSEKGLQIAEKRRDVKGKGEKESYTHLNAEFQRIAMRDKKVFLSDQCKEIEENNRMGKTRDLFKEIRDIKGLFHVKMGEINDRKGMDLTEAGDGTPLQSSCLENPMGGRAWKAAVHGVSQSRTRLKRLSSSSSSNRSRRY